MNNLNIVGEMRSIISSTQVSAGSKINATGGDLLEFGGYQWLVVHIDESFPQHCKFIAQKQAALL